MDDAVKQQVDEATEKALRRAAFVDFRDGYRDRLRWLKDERPQTFASALAHYNDILVPNVTAGADPIREWIEYGQRLGELAGPGKVVCIDEIGRARPLERIEGLILHVPDDAGVPALSLAVPRELSAAQTAALELLVARGAR